MHVVEVSICKNYNNTRKRYVFSSKTNLRSRILKRTVLPELQGFTGYYKSHCLQDIVMHKIDFPNISKLFY